ncbi:hypothetical protein HID58_056056 [Brassica napus]|uniref:Uncharacterized protein n=1 Tax=Brassica napus TaxID=3708 RepID=A0ABQ8AM41_BRANA|nr:hypothetical protein HID58_056056 [Brassica napus]
MVQGYKADAREFVIPNHRSLLNSQHGCRSYQHARIQQAGGHPKGSYLTYLSVYYRVREYIYITLPKGVRVSGKDVKMILMLITAYLKESLLQLKAISSGDPSTSLKPGVALPHSLDVQHINIWNLLEGIVKGVKVLQDMLENGCFPNKMTFLIMFKGFHDLGKEENNI